MTNHAPQYPNRAAQLRARLLGQVVAPASKHVIDGETFYIRTALIADRTKIGEVAGLVLKTKDGQVDLNNIPMTAMVCAALIVLAVDEVGNPLCTAADLEALQATPAGGWVEQLGKLCLIAGNGVAKGEVSGEEKKVEGSSTSSPASSDAPSAS